MLVRKQNGFDDFVCIADKCPKSCCIGWQIVIDDKSLQKRLSAIGAAALAMQYDYDTGEVAQIGKTCEALDRAEKIEDPCRLFSTEAESAGENGILPDYSYALGSLDFLAGLEVLESSWTDIIQKTGEFFSEKGEDSEAWKKAMHPEEPEMQAVFEKLFLSLLYTYFCGSVYDGQLYARCMIALWSVRWIMLIFAATDLPIDRVIYLYAREIEHSDENINALIAFFEGEIPE